MKATQLAQIMGKQKSEISKWLSGQHTFSLRTIVSIENALGMDIIQIGPTFTTGLLTVNHPYKTNTLLKKGINPSYVGEYKAD